MSNPDHRTVHALMKKGEENTEKKSDRELNDIDKTSLPKSQYQRRSKRSSVENQVAFFASMTSHNEHLGKGQDIIFDHAVTNIGNAYNTHHGTFIAPADGVYVFTVTLGHYSSLGTAAGAHFVVNGTSVATLWVGDEQSSQTIIVRLRPGDDVSVQNSSTDRSYYGGNYCTFSGFLLYDDVPINTI